MRAKAAPIRVLTAVPICDGHDSAINTGLHRVAVPAGRFTRPSWAPGLREVWVASGSDLYAVAEGAPPALVSTGMSSGRIVALRFSADGSRLAKSCRAFPRNNCCRGRLQTR